MVETWNDLQRTSISIVAKTVKALDAPLLKEHSPELPHADPPKGKPKKLVVAYQNYVLAVPYKLHLSVPQQADLFIPWS